MNKIVSSSEDLVGLDASILPPLELYAKVIDLLALKPREVYLESPGLS